MIAEKQINILLIEDEIITAKAEKIQLEKYGYTIFHTTTGEEGIHFIAKDEVKIDLILMDIDLGPGIDGTIAAERILNEKDIPIIFLSSHTDPEIVEKTEKITSYGYVVKNSGPTILDTSIKMAFRLFEAKKKEKQSEARYRLLFEGSIQPIVIYDDNAQIKMLNQAAAKNLKRPVSECINRPLGDFIPENHELTVSRIKEVLTNLKPLYVEDSMTINNETFWFWSVIQPVQIPDEINNLVQIISYDITAQKKMEWKLFENEERYKQLHTSAQIGVGYYSLDGKILSFNDVALSHMQMKKEELIGKYIHDIFPKNEARVYLDRINATIETDSVLKFEDKVHLPSGLKWFISIFSLFKDSVQKKMGVQIISIDITNRKEAEESLIESEQRYRTLVNTTPFGIELIDKTGKILYSNPAHHKIHGYKDGELIGSYVWEFIDDEQRAIKTKDYFHSIINNPVKPEVYFLMNKTKDGKLIHIQINWDYIKNTKNEIEAIISIVSDITDKKLAEEELKRSLKEKEALLKEVNHRIKNNIANISNLLSLQAQSLSNPEAIDALQEAINRVNSMSILYNKILTSGDYREVSIKNYLEELIESILEISSKNNVIEINKEIDNFKLPSNDLFPLGIIINELMTNSLKYAFPNNRGIISLQVKQLNNHITIKLQDNGVGLPEGFSIQDSKGFGLLLTEMLCQQINAQLSFEVNNGTTWIIEFKVNE